jgi:hypothetical protein
MSMSTFSLRNPTAPESASSRIARPAVAQRNVITTSAAPFGEFLSKTELRELTGRARRVDQLSKLKELALPHRCIGLAKNVLVSRQHVRDWLNGSKVVAPRAPTLKGIK